MHTGITRQDLARWVGAAVAVAGIVLVVYVFWVGPTVDRIFSSVADDHCPLAADGEPDRSDQDCYGSWGHNYVEEWDRLHPSP